jgi:hypothetical protein
MPTTLRLASLRQHPVAFAILGGILTAAVMLVLITPPEATLGDGIKIVFIHAALIQTGVIGLVVAGLLGIVVLATAHAEIDRWMRTIAIVAVIFYAAGVITSMIAAKVNWGGVFLQEPRMAASLNTLALALIILILTMWLAHLPDGLRVTGLLNTGLAVYLIWSILFTPLLLHPRNPIGTSTFPALRWSFYGLLALCILAAGWSVLQVRRSALKE